MTQTELVIDVHGMTKRFGNRTVVRDLDMQVSRGEIHGFLGPNGSGKTTFIRMLCGLLSPDAGSGTCLGYDVISESAKVKLNTGYMAQRFSLYEDLTVEENLHFVARLYGLRDRGSAVGNCIERMQLGQFARQLTGRLSGGWKQRLALAACILHKPKLLLLDEPTAGVDPEARHNFWDQVHGLSSEGISALISTQNMDEAERCHRLTYIAHGNLLAAGSPEDLVSRSGLITWAVSGGDLHDLAESLRLLPGVEQVVVFGNALHVSGRDEVALRKNIACFMDGQYQVHRIQTSLEEVFVHFMQKAKKV